MNYLQNKHNKNRGKCEKISLNGLLVPGAPKIDKSHIFSAPHYFATGQRKTIIKETAKLRRLQRLQTMVDEKLEEMNGKLENPFFWERSKLQEKQYALIGMKNYLANFNTLPSTEQQTEEQTDEKPGWTEKIATLSGKLGDDPSLNWNKVLQSNREIGDMQDLLHAFAYFYWAQVTRDLDPPQLS